MKTLLLAVPVVMALAACATQSQIKLATGSTDVACPAQIQRSMENRRPQGPAGHNPTACAMRAAWHDSDVTARNNRRNLAAPSSEPVY
jgi:hypothetical protein